jgi:hypothetical protein
VSQLLTASLPLPSGTVRLSDQEFVGAFESCTLASDAFLHYDHIRLAWIYLREHALADATERMAASIRRFAQHYGAGAKYHDTMTRVWMRLVAHGGRAPGSDHDFAAFAAANPHLFDKQYVFQFYSRPRLFSNSARAGWVEPDLIPLPDAPRRAAEPVVR